jgi:hypothetical protein
MKMQEEMIERGKLNKKNEEICRIIDSIENG